MIEPMGPLHRFAAKNSPAAIFDVSGQILATFQRANWHLECGGSNPSAPITQRTTRGEFDTQSNAIASSDMADRDTVS
jgi:hypothetical protein